MFVSLSLEAAILICRNMRKSDLDCLHALLGDISIEAFAIDRFQSNGAAWAYLQNGIPVVMGGVTETVPWLGQAWMVSTDNVSIDSWKKIIRFSRKVFINASRHFQRIDAHVLVTWPEAKKYADAIGFKLVNVREKVGREGEDLYDFAIIGPLEQPEKANTTTFEGETA